MAGTPTIQDRGDSFRQTDHWQSLPWLHKKKKKKLEKDQTQQSVATEAPTVEKHRTVEVTPQPEQVHKPSTTLSSNPSTTLLHYFQSASLHSYFQRPQKHKLTKRVHRNGLYVSYSLEITNYRYCIFHVKNEPFWRASDWFTKSSRFQSTQDSFADWVFFLIKNKYGECNVWNFIWFLFNTSPNVPAFKVHSFPSDFKLWIEVNDYYLG